MKRFILLILVISGFSPLAKAQWQLIPIVPFTNPIPDCVCDYLGEVASNSTIYWSHDVACGQGSSFSTYYHIYRTTDGGLNWDLKVNVYYDYYSLLKIDFISQDTGYYLRYEMGATEIFRTSNGMNSFNNCNYPEFPEYTDAKMVAFNDMWVLDIARKILHLENNTFQIIHSFPSSLYFNRATIDVTQNNNIYFACNSLTGGSNYNNLILGSKDNGMSWDTLLMEDTPFITKIKFSSDSVGFVVGLSGKIMKTEDAGQTWITKPSGISEHLHSIDFIDDLTWIAAGASGMILVTFDGGDTWNTLPPPTNNYLLKVKFPEKNGIVFIQYLNNQIWRANIWDLITKEELSFDTDEYINIYPNPARNNFTIELNNPDIKNSYVEFFNLYGKKVYSNTIVNNKETFNCSYLPPGIYLVKIVNQGKYYTQRLVVQ